MSKADNVERMMLDLINAERAAAGVAPLRLELRLNAAAEDHSAWMLDADVFSHTGAGGSNPGDRMRAADFPFEGRWTWGENVAWQSERGAAGIADDVAGLHESLMNSPGHRANILNADFEVIGIGVERGDYGGWDAVMATQNFARSGASMRYDDAAPPAPEPTPPTPRPEPPQPEPQPEPPAPRPDDGPQTTMPETTMTVFDAATDEALFDLASSMVIDRASVRGLDLTMVVDTDLEGVESARLSMAGRVKVENVEPYALFGDRRGDLRGGDALGASTTAEVDLFAGNRASGERVGGARAVIDMDGRVLRGTDGADTFALDEARTTSEVVRGFTEADTLLFFGDVFQDAGDVLDRATVRGGDTLIDLGDGDRLVIEDYATLSADDILV